MDWEQSGILCETELKKLEAVMPPLADFFHSHENAGEAFLRYEKETDVAVGYAVRQFTETGEWPSLTPIQKVMLWFRLDFAASTAYLLKEQPAPWTDAAQPNQREERLRWLMLFAWDGEGFEKLRRILHRLTGQNK